MPAPHHTVFFTDRMPFLPPNQRHQSTEPVSLRKCPHGHQPTDKVYLSWQVNEETHCTKTKCWKMTQALNPWCSINLLCQKTCSVFWQQSWPPNTSRFHGHQPIFLKNSQLNWYYTQINKLYCSRQCLARYNGHMLFFLFITKSFQFRHMRIPWTGAS